MKLNIEYIPKQTVPKPIISDKYENPVGLWGVTTEGDCEGRTMKNLGFWYGHVAEIAFHLADKCFYSLHFKSINGTRTAGGKPPKIIQTNRNYVWVSFNIDSKTWSMTPEERADWVADFLNSKDQIDVYGVYNGASYFASACLVLKN